MQPWALPRGLPVQSPGFQKERDSQGPAAPTGLVGGGRLERDSGYSFSMGIRNWPETLLSDGSLQAPKMQTQLSLQQPPRRDEGRMFGESLASDSLAT